MKKNILVIFNVGDVFCYERSSRFIKRDNTFIKISDFIESNKEDIFGYICVNKSYDTKYHVNPVSSIVKTKVLDVKLHSDNLISVDNELKIRQTEFLTYSVNGDILDWMLPSKDYNLLFTGIDIDSIFDSSIKQTIDLGYTLTVLSDLIKPSNKKTITNIINISRKRKSKLCFRKSI